jgi:hypothetical protein
MFNPHNHHAPCPEHNVTACLTCHEVKGECSSGGCTRRATRSFEVTRTANGSVAYIEHFCDSSTCLMIACQANYKIATLVARD